MHLLGIFTVLSLFAQCLGQTYQLHDADASGLVNASDTCIASFSENVTCTRSVGQLYTNPFYDPGDALLTNLCTSTCLNSLKAHLNRVKSTCSGAEYYNEYEDTRWLPWYPDEFIFYSFNMACLKRSTGQFCTSYLRSLTKAAECDECILKSFQLQINSPFGVDKAMRDNYASLTASCKATGYPVTTATPLLISTPSPTLTCSGTQYTIRPTDTFFSVPKDQSVATDHLIGSNGLPHDPTQFPEKGTLCISLKCQTYVLRRSDTCASIATAFNTTIVRLKSWNANINELCNNLERFVGDTFCVSNPFGDYEIPDIPETTPVDTPAPIPNDLAPNVTNRCGQYYRVDVGDDCSTVTLKFNIALKDFIFLNPMLDNGCGNMWLNYSYCVQPVGDITNYPGYGGGPTLTIPPFTAGPKTPLPWIDLEPTPPSDLIIIPFAKDTREDCWSYIWINDTTPESVNCWGISNYAGLTHDQFVLWNPSLDINSDDDTDPSYDYECAVQTSVSYCIALASPTPVVPVPLKPPTPRAAGEIPGCIVWVQIGADTICRVLLKGFDLSMETFHSLNPSVGSDCNNLVVGTYYCLSTKDLGIRADNDEDDDYDPPTATTTLASTTSGVATPTPTQSGMVSGCTKFYKVQSGDGCWAIANDNVISLEDFYAWNPAVGSSCGTLQPNFYVCIGRSVSGGTTSKATTASPTKISISSTKNAPSTTIPSVPGPTQTGIPKNCNKWVMQKAGVYCYDMAQAAGIALDKLYALNPALGGDCSGLWPGYAYCVGTST